MKFTKKLFLTCMLAALALAALSISGCKQPADYTRDDCMSDFASAINNGNYGDVGDTLSKNASRYSEATAASFWETRFPSGHTFTYTITGDTAIGTYNAVDYTFTFDQNSDDEYRIRTVTASGSTAFFY